MEPCTEGIPVALCVYFTIAGLGVGFVFGLGYGFYKLAIGSEDRP